ncbi:MAG: holo-[acyl-carrier-protein] synthase [Clostridiales bacterium]|nr:holo-[acyl-carrier-protein] synthase [Clostridiales bacterium]
MEVGIDILDIDRMNDLCNNESFLNKYFADNEIEYIKTCSQLQKPKTLAGYYSIKEAFLKAIGLGIGRGIDLKDISIWYNDMGRPHIELKPSAKEIFNGLGYNNITINVTDSDTVAVAVCIVY